MVSKLKRNPLITKLQLKILKIQLCKYIKRISENLIINNFLIVNIQKKHLCLTRLLFNIEGRRCHCYSVAANSAISSVSTGRCTIHASELACQPALKQLCIYSPGFLRLQEYTRLHQRSVQRALSTFYLGLRLTADCFVTSLLIIKWGVPILFFRVESYGSTVLVSGKCGVDRIPVTAVVTDTRGPHLKLFSKTYGDIANPFLYQ